jgi:hypothetical protein
MAPPHRGKEPRRRLCTRRDERFALMRRKTEGRHGGKSRAAAFTHSSEMSDPSGFDEPRTGRVSKGLKSKLTGS